jgi:hypothetical protein
MQLSYRGVPYEYNPTSVETIEGKVGGKYRGLPWRHTQVKMNKKLRVQPTYELYYRGVSPRRNQTNRPNGIPVAQPNSINSF